MEMFRHFRAFCDNAAGREKHVFRMPKRLCQAAVEPFGRGTDDTRSPSRGRPALHASPRIVLPFQAPLSIL
jgi:hypothetical protein